MVKPKSGLARPQESMDKDKLIARLKEAREYVGLSQEKVAAFLGLSRSAVSEMEGGRRNVTAVELKKLSNMYQRPVSWFTDDLVEGVPADVEYLARTATGLSENDRTELQRFAEFLKIKSKANDG